MFAATSPLGPAPITTASGVPPPPRSATPPGSPRPGSTGQTHQARARIRLIGRCLLGTAVQRDELIRAGKFHYLRQVWIRRYKRQPHAQLARDMAGPAQDQPRIKSSALAAPISSLASLDTCSPNCAASSRAVISGESAAAAHSPFLLIAPPERACHTATAPAAGRTGRRQGRPGRAGCGTVTSGTSGPAIRSRPSVPGSRAAR